MKQNALVDDEGLFILKMFEGVIKVDVSNLGNIRFLAKFLKIIGVASNVEVELGELVHNIISFWKIVLWRIFIFFQMCRIYKEIQFFLLYLLFS